MQIPLKANLTVPQWLCSDGHIAQNAFELIEYEWKIDNRALEGKIQLIGKFPLTMYLHMPKGYDLTKAECLGAKCSATQEVNNILAVTFETKKPGDYAFRIKF